MASLKLVLRTRDLEAARSFYEDVLGFEAVDAWDESHGSGCVYGFGDGLLELNQLVKSDLPDKDRFDLQFKVDDVSPWVERLEGMWEYTGPKTHPWGETTLRLHDPDGTLITIFAATG